MPPPAPPKYEKQNFLAKNKWYLIGGGIVAVGGGIYWIIHSHSTAATNNAANTTANGSLGTTTGGEQYLIPSGSDYGGYSGSSGGGGLYSEISSLEADITGLTSALTGYVPPTSSTPPNTPAVTNGTSPAPAGSGSPSGSSGSTGGNASGSGGGSAGSTSPPVAVTNTVQTYGVGDFDTTVNNTLLDQALTSVATTGAPSSQAQANALATFSSEGHPIATTFDPTNTTGTGAPIGMGTDSSSGVEGQSVAIQPVGATVQTVPTPTGGQNETLAAANVKLGGIAGNPSMYG
jgi:hypothetical protein